VLAKTVAAIAKRNGTKAGADSWAGKYAVSNLSVLRNKVRATGRDGADSNTAYALDLNARLPRNSVLHGQIARLLVSEERRRVTHRETTGRLDRRALARMGAGARDVFSQRDDTPGIDTAVMILVDGSDSMENGHPSRMRIAQTAAWHIAKAAEAACGKVAVAAFHSQGNEAYAVITIVKPWERQTADSAAAIGTIHASGMTPLSPAIIECSRLLGAVNATRRILLCLTDGQCQFRENGVRAACTIADDYGVEPVGIGINCSSVVRAFPPRYSVNVESLDQLAATGLGVLVAMLEDANPAAAD
jgi:Mg-chelatase subunit ChlD